MNILLHAAKSGRVSKERRLSAGAYLCYRQAVEDPTCPRAGTGTCGGLWGH